MRKEALGPLVSAVGAILWLIVLPPETGAG